MKIEQRRELIRRMKDTKDMYWRLRKMARRAGFSGMTPVEVANLTKVPEKFGIDWTTVDIESIIDYSVSYEENKDMIKKHCGV